MIVSLLAVPAAFALQVTVRAELGADLRTLRGTITFDEPVTLIDPLAALPPPPDDRTLFRTFPGKVDPGAMTWTPLAGTPPPEGEGAAPREGGGALRGGEAPLPQEHLSYRFETRLPKRYGELGYLPGDGAWANGGWYPQPVGEHGEPRVAGWTVDIALPTGVVGVLNGVVGEGGLAWRGTADRAALAAIVGGRVTELPVRGGTVRFVERNLPERAVRKLLARAVEEAWPLLEPPDLTIVEDLDLLHLARAAPGMVFLSDRAFRMQPGFLRPYHIGAVRSQVIGAALQGARPAFADGWTRDFAASAIAKSLPAPSVRKLLGWFSWNPVIDALLYDGTLPYFADVFDEPFGGPPGLFDTLGGRIPGRAAAEQLDDLQGPGTARKLTGLVLGGGTWASALDAVGVPAEIAEAWTRPYVSEQDYVVDVDADGARVRREAAEDAPPEVVVVHVDGEPMPAWVAGPGPDELPLITPGEAHPKKIQVDPKGHVLQEDLANDRWPVRWTMVVNGGFYNINPSQHSFDLAADLWFRRRNDTRNLFVAGVEHDAQDVVSVDVGWLRWIGPLVNRRTRVHRLSFFLGPSLLDPAFRPTDDGAIALGGSFGYSWDTRTDPNFALSGHRLAVTVGGGFVPQSTDRWASASLYGVKLVSPHPRHVFAVKGKASWASGAVEHRLLPLGGGGDVRAVPESEVVGNARLDGSLEYRWAPLRNASIPLPLLWLSDVHVSPGVDAGVLWRGEDRYAAVGATLGVHVLTDLLGVQPNLAGLTVAMPVWTSGFEAGAPQVYIDFAHAF